MKSQKINKSILRNMFEALVIFLSLYAAFLLEAERSRDFERELLIGKLEVLLEEIDHDSVKFHDFYEDIDTRDRQAFLNIWEEVYYDSLALELIKSGEVDSVFKLFKEEMIISFWPESWTDEPFTYESILVNYSHLILDDQTLHELDFYFRQRRLLNDLNAQSIMSRERLIVDLYDKFYIMDPFITSRDKTLVVNSPLFKNTVSRSLIIRKGILQQAKELTQLIKLIKLAIRHELELQDEKI